MANVNKCDICGKVMRISVLRKLSNCIFMIKRPLRVTSLVSKITIISTAALIVLNEFSAS